MTCLDLKRSGWSLSILSILAAVTLAPGQITFKKPRINNLKAWSAEGFFAFQIHDHMAALPVPGHFLYPTPGRGSLETGLAVDISGRLTRLEAFGARPLKTAGANPSQAAQ